MTDQMNPLKTDKGTLSGKEVLSDQLCSQPGQEDSLSQEDPPQRGTNEQGIQQH